MLISVQDVTHIYQQEPPVKALNEVTFNIQEGECIGLIGATGSGKSTLVQMFNGLLEPTEGQVLIRGQNIFSGDKDLQELRQEVGLVFQYPEHQIFEETIYREISYGPRNLNLKEQQIEQRVKEVLDLVEMDFDQFRDRSPFNLSGGQQRKIALAGVLAMKPQILILDEPYAGLDPQGRKQLTSLLQRLQNQKNMTLVLISHRMEEIALLADRVLVLKEGEIFRQGTPRKIFSQPEILQNLSLDIPQITEVLTELKKCGLTVRTDIFEIEKAAQEIITEIEGQC